MSAHFHLLGQLDFDQALALQRRLVYDVGASKEPRSTVLFCEHGELITVGRQGSRAHIRWTNSELQRRQLSVRWLNRGGGCVLHGPGQLAVYPIVPLEGRSWSVGEYLRRLQTGIIEGLAQLQIAAAPQGGDYHLWGRTGLLAVIGVRVQDWVTSHGVFLNVAPAMERFGWIDAADPSRLAAGRKATMSCLLAERRLPVTMTRVRAALVESLASSLSFPAYHVHTGHPWLERTAATAPARVDGY